MHDNTVSLPIASACCILSEILHTLGRSHHPGVHVWACRLEVQVAGSSLLATRKVLLWPLIASSARHYQGSLQHFPAWQQASDIILRIAFQHVPNLQGMVLCEVQTALI